MKQTALWKARVALAICAFVLVITWIPNFVFGALVHALTRGPEDTWGQFFDEMFSDLIALRDAVYYTWTTGEM